MSILYQHCMDCNEPIHSEQNYGHESAAVHTKCYIKRIKSQNTALKESLALMARRACDDTFLEGSDCDKASKLLKEVG